MKVNMNFCQQGDVLIEKFEGKLPEGLKRKTPTDKGLVIREGEVTGHAHRVEDCPDVEMYENDDGTIFIVAKKEFIVDHEEHKSHVIPAGIYISEPVREYDHLTEESKPVRD